MYKTLFLLLILSVFTAAHLPPKRHIVFFGDSITELGVQPGGYIRLMDTLLQKKGVSENVELTGAGVSGNKVYDLYLRLEDDVLARNPDVVVIWIGVNDVWHKRTFGTGTDADKFERFYTAIIRKLQARGIKVVVCTPAVVGERTDMTNELDGDLNRYSVLIRKLAKNFDCPLVDLRQDFADRLHLLNTANKDRGVLTTDGVHLNAAGNAFAAQRMTDVLTAAGAF